MITTMNQNHVVSKKEHTKIESYIKYFAYKTVQAVVQSRTCVKRKSRSRTCSGAYDWGLSPLMLTYQFNVSIFDEPSIQKVAEKALSSQSMASNFSLCIEIQLQTPDRDKLVLETWCLSLKDPCDVSLSATSVYPCMCVLLKSIISVSRVTPAYKLSGQQNPDSYTILYRIYFGPPQVLVLGEGCKESKIGEVITPLGTLHASIAFRTKMTITPQKIDKESPFMVKSNYFEPDMSPKRLHAPPINGFNFSNQADKRRSPADCISNGVAEPINNSYRGKYPLSFADSDHEFDDHTSNFLNGDFKEGYQVTGAFAPATIFPDPSLFPELILPDKPMLNLPAGNIKSVQKDAPNRNSDNNANLNNSNVNNVVKQDEVDYNCNANEEGITKMSCSGNSDCDDFVMVDLRPPFAHSDGGGDDLGAFFRECQCAPPLASFAAQQSIEEQVTDITNQLAQFETSMQDFDSFVDAICQVDAKK